MKRVEKLFFSYLFILTVFGCSQNSPTGKEEVVGGESFVSLDSNIDLNAARSIAQMKFERLIADGNCNWSDKSVITKHYPVYLPQQEYPSYYEFKVETEGKDAGFILVNIDKTDVVVPEVRLEGKTLFEEYNEVITRSVEFRVVRINLIESYAESKLINRDSGDREIIASSGIDGYSVRIIDQKASDLISSYREEAGRYIKENGCIVNYEPETLSTYYNAFVSTRSTEKVIRKTTELISKYKLYNGYATPRWNQPNYEGRVIGCGVTAWAILLGYWHQHHNKNIFMIDDNRLDLYSQKECKKVVHFEIPIRIEARIFDNDILGDLSADSISYLLGFYEKTIQSDGVYYSTRKDKIASPDDESKILALMNKAGYYTSEQMSNNIYLSMVELYGIIGSKPWSGDNDSTITYPLNMIDGFRFAVSKGYRSSSCTWKAGYNRYDQNVIYNEVAAGRPVIILVASKTGTSVTKGVADHYVVVEGVMIDYYNSSSAYAQSTGFLINYGNAGKYGWAYNAVKDYDVYDAYIVNIK